MKTILYEKFENKENYIKIKKKYNLINIKSKKRYDKNIVFAIYTRFQKKLSEKYLYQFKKLKFIVSPTTGLNHIDLNHCEEKKIKIINLKKNNRDLKSITSTSELTLSMILVGIRKLSYFYNKNFKLSERYKYNIYQFKNYTVGIIGYGRIGKELFRYLKFLKFRVFFYDIDTKYKKKQGYINLNKLLKLSDIISLNMNYTELNSNFLNKEILKKCKKNLMLINTARGELVNELDLLSFLKKNKSSSAYLDVIKNETVNYKNNPVYKYSLEKKNLFLSPHIGGSTKDALKITENIVINEFFKKTRLNKYF